MLHPDNHDHESGEHSPQNPDGLPPEEHDGLHPIPPDEASENPDQNNGALVNATSGDNNRNLDDHEEVDPLIGNNITTNVSEPVLPTEAHLRFGFSFSKERDFFTRRPDQYVFIASITEDSIDKSLQIVNYNVYGRRGLGNCHELLEHPVDSKIFEHDLGFEDFDIDLNIGMQSVTITFKRPYVTDCLHNINLMAN